MNSIIDKLLYEDEGSTLDFKKEQYPFDNADDNQKSELLKDILAFANSWRRIDAYILIGVKEIKGGKSIVIGINQDLDDAKLQQFVNSKTQRPVTFEYKSALHDGKKIGVIRIAVQTRPVFLKKNYGKLLANTVYIRRGSSTDISDPDEIASIGISKPEIYQIQPNILIEFAQYKSHIRLGNELEIDAIKLKIPPKEEIPDYEKSMPGFPSLSFGYTNKHFYRELINYYYWKLISRPFSFYVENISDVPALAIKIEISTQKDNTFGFLREFEIPTEPTADSFLPGGNFRAISNDLINRSATNITEESDKWLIVIETPRIQPKSSYYSEENIFFYSQKDVSLKLNVSCYADNLSTPLNSELLLKAKVEEKPGDLSTILRMHYKDIQQSHKDDE